ncbi:MAG: hypothetical protein OXD35_00280 [Thiotrichales bacterium]|nr:hypothetical protein [Thiotrichales bacterium]
MEKKQYVIAYDLNHADDEYKTLYAELESWGGKRIQYSVWVAPSAKENPQEIVDYLRAKGLIRPEDNLLVIRLGRDNWAKWNFVIDPNLL